MNPDNVPPWGCPWHGLVRDGLLENDHVTMPYPQPGSQAHAAGQTRLVQHPAAPGDPRPGVEQADDRAAGREWRSQAIIAGGNGQLHGRSLGATGWIYIDSEGRAWQANTVVLSSAGTRTLTLKKFGEIGVAPDQYSYQYAQPSPGEIPAGILPSNGQYTLGVALADSTPTGDRAVFCITLTLWNADPREQAAFPFIPLCWVEVTLSGPGDACTVTVETVCSPEQALGTIISEEAEDLDQTFSYAPPDTMERTPREMGEINLRISTARPTPRAAVLNRVIGMLYSEEGRLRTVTLSRDTVTTGEDWAPELDWGPLVMTGSASMTYVRTVRFRMEIDNEVLVSEEFEEVMRVDLTVWSQDSPISRYRSISAEATAVTTFQDGSPDRLRTVSVYTQVAASGATNNPLHISVLRDDKFENIRSAALLPQNRVTSGWSRRKAVMHSLNLYSWAIEAADTRAPGWGTRVFGAKCLSNAGVMASPPLSAPMETRVYGSWCPVTGRVVLDTQPVCWV